MHVCVKIKESFKTHVCLKLYCAMIHMLVGAISKYYLNAFLMLSFIFEHTVEVIRSLLFLNSQLKATNGSPVDLGKDSLVLDYRLKKIKHVMILKEEKGPMKHPPPPKK